MNIYYTINNSILDKYPTLPTNDIYQKYLRNVSLMMLNVLKSFDLKLSLSTLIRYYFCILSKYIQFYLCLLRTICILCFKLLWNKTSCNLISIFYVITNYKETFIKYYGCFMFSSFQRMGQQRWILFHPDLNRYRKSWTSNQYRTK